MLLNRWVLSSTGQTNARNDERKTKEEERQAQAKAGCGTIGSEIN
jgi:hypothetical protein